MSWQAVTKKDFRDAIRSPYFWAVTGAVTLVMAFFLLLVRRALYRLIADGELDVPLTTDLLIGSLQGQFQVLIPVLAIVAAYTAIAGERDSGTLKLLLSLPNSRRDVVVGKLLGRAGVVATPIVLAFAVGVVAFPLSEFTFVPTTYLAFGALTLLLGLVFVGFTVGISAAASTGNRAAIGTFGVFAYLLFLWGDLARNLTRWAAELLDLSQGTALQVELFLRLLNPMAAYQSLVYRIQIAGPIEARAILIARESRPAQLQAQQFLMRNVFVDQVPWYFSDPAVVVLLLLWLVIPLAGGYYLFNEADL